MLSASSNVAVCVLPFRCYHDAHYHQNQRPHNGQNQPNLRPLVLARKPHASPRFKVLGNTGSGAKAGALDDAVLDTGFSGPPECSHHTLFRQNRVVVYFESFAFTPSSPLCLPQLCRHIETLKEEA